MAKLAHFGLFCVMASIMIAVSLAENYTYSTLVGVGCSDAKTYTYQNASAFWGNMFSVLESLTANLSANGFDTSMHNQAGKTDPVYAVAACRKYLKAEECSDCIYKAAIQLNNYCSAVTNGRIHLDGCFFRYENTSFYGQDVDPGFSAYCGSTNDSNPQTFAQRAATLSTQLIANSSANNNYATGSIDGSLYGLAQCWPTLTNSSCQECLTDAQNLLLTCPPKLEGRGLEAGCFMRYSNYSFFSDILTSVSTNLTSLPGKSSTKLVPILPILLASIGGTGLIAVLCLVFYKCVRHRKGYCGTDENLGSRGNFGHVFFDYKLLRDSTGNFHRNNMLGKGGFGEVYKGRIPDGRNVAVKKLYGRHETTQAAEDFLTEVKLLTNVRHRNLVRLLGCCTRGHERLLVYEFMSNNSLHKHLFGEIRKPLSWENRLNIIVGVARGLAYLHEDSNVRIIHRDIKCGNILLDDRFHPKIADFGMARFFPEGQTHVSTRVGGTIGYTAPEYAVHGQLTEKADVYSYGIVVLEIVSGRKCMDATLPAPMNLLLEWAWNQYRHDRVLDIVDPTLEGQYPREQALRVITVALLCTQGSWALRPAMSQVGLILTNNSEIPARPTQPAFIDAAAASSENSSAASEPTGLAAAPPQGSHGSMSVSLFPR